MYESPIQVYVNNMLEQMRQNEENQIVAEVSQAVGINVEKEELIKALQYDRNQYEKGYEDALKRKTGKWIKAREWSEGFGMGEKYGWFYECSECNKQVKGGYPECNYDYCPYCGSDNRDLESLGESFADGYEDGLEDK